MLAMSVFDAFRGSDKHDPAGVLGHLLLDGVDQLQGAAGVLTFVECGLDPDGEELRAEVAVVKRLQVEVAVAEWIGQVKVLINKALRRVGMGVDDQCGAMDQVSGLALWGRSEEHTSEL